MNRQHDIFCTADETALIEFLTGPEAAPKFKAKGFEPG